MIYDTLEEAVSAYVAQVQATEHSKLRESAIAFAAVESKLGTKEAVLEHLGNQSGRSRTTMHQRWKVGMVFPPDTWNESLTWSHHELCSRTWSADTPDLPHRWLARAADDQWSTRKLAMALAGDSRYDPDTAPVRFLADAVPVRLSAVGSSSVTVTGVPVSLTQFLRGWLNRAVVFSLSTVESPASI
jgi:hypothetical protein